MAEPAINNEATHSSLLYSYSANCSQSYTNVKSDYTENISTLEENLPNNNIIDEDALLDCHLDGGCASNNTKPHYYSTDAYCADNEAGCSPNLAADQATPIAANAEALSSDYKLSTNYDEKHNESLGTKHSDGAQMQKNVTFSINNGVIKKKRKSKNEVSLSKPTSVKRQQQRVGSGRGRPPKRAFIETYHSQISGDKNAIKIRIKKAHTSSQITSPVKRTRPRKKQKRTDASDTDQSDYDESSRRIKNDSSAVSVSESDTRPASPEEQSLWGEPISERFLYQIFEYVCNDQGALPVLVNLCKVCKVWQNVALTSKLWQVVDLSTVVKDRAKTDIRLHWLIQNRLDACQDLNLSDWKIKNIPMILEELCLNCPELRGLNLSGWSGLTAENLKYLTSECSKLERLDLSSVNGSNLGTKSAVNASPLVCLAKTMSSRLTHLVLAHNKLAGFSQILTALSAHCPNLQLLDLSNIKTHAYNSSLLHVEKLQAGCPKLRVLRVTNSQILLAPTSLTTQMASPGFPELEELSLAGIEDDQTTSKFIDDNGIERILKSSHKLRLLDVRGCIKITDSGLVKVPAWDLEHLFLSGCYVTRLNHSGLELIVQKWSHSLVEVDLAWSTATEPLDAAVMTFAEKGIDSPLRILNLCGSSVSLEAVKAVLAKCPLIQSINLQSCRALPRGIKRLYESAAVAELRTSLENKPKSEDLDSTGSEEQPESSEERPADY